ncbi:uncharacterized protein METZ01_LOCUS346842, partial [marine metagenome]
VKVTRRTESTMSRGATKGIMASRPCSSARVWMSRSLKRGAGRIRSPWIPPRVSMACRS